MKFELLFFIGTTMSSFERFKKINFPADAGNVDDMIFYLEFKRKLRDSAIAQKRDKLFIKRLNGELGWNAHDLYTKYKIQYSYPDKLLLLCSDIYNECQVLEAAIIITNFKNS